VGIIVSARLKISNSCVRQGYADLVERGCRLAQELGKQIDESPAFELLEPVRLKSLCFTLATGDEPPSLAAIRQYLAIVAGQWYCLSDIDDPSRAGGHPGVNH
jgi:hypothetical protein